jgi:hypothetical protein
VINKQAAPDQAARGIRPKHRHAHVTMQDPGTALFAGPAIT